ncbi:hypothetical protein FUSNEC_GEN_284_09255 [Fusobacterium necrophorum subsp. funduliforme]
MRIKWHKKIKVILNNRKERKYGSIGIRSY